MRLGGLARASTIQRPCRGSCGHAIGIAKWIVKMGQVESSRGRIIKDRPDSERGLRSKPTNRRVRLETNGVGGGSAAPSQTTEKVCESPSFLSPFTRASGCLALQCLRRSWWRVNFQEQRVQGNGRAVVWVRMCDRRLKGLLNLLEQTGQT